MTGSEFVDDLFLPTLPFALAVLLRSFGGMSRRFAAKAFDREREVPSTPGLSDSLREIAIDASVVSYTSLAFLLSLLLASSTTFVYVLRSDIKWLAFVPGLLLLGGIAAWALIWQDFTYSELFGARGKPMRVAGWLQILLQWAVTILTLVPTERPHAPGK